MINRDQVAISLLKSLQPNPFESSQNLDLIKAALDEFGSTKRSEGYSDGYDEGYSDAVENDS